MPGYVHEQVISNTVPCSLTNGWPSEPGHGCAATLKLGGVPALVEAVVRVEGTLLTLELGGGLGGVVVGAAGPAGEELGGRTVDPIW